MSLDRPTRSVRLQIVSGTKGRRTKLYELKNCMIMYIKPRVGKNLPRFLFGLIQLIGSTSDPANDLNLL